ncbi:MAG: cell division protein ZapA [Nitrospirae bacterium]|nr:cell division protein ZapA [Nitrospirota bacterium]
MASADVLIGGQRYTVKGEESEQYIRELAGYIDKKLSDVADSALVMNPLKASILASLSIADELFKLRKEYESLATKIESGTSDLESILE